MSREIDDGRAMIDALSTDGVLANPSTARRQSSISEV
jgi:hypothetical protein